MRRVSTVTMRVRTIPAKDYTESAVMLVGFCIVMQMFTPATQNWSFLWSKQRGNDDKEVYLYSCVNMFVVLT